jgi:hypothetical protein
MKRSLSADNFFHVEIVTLTPIQYWKITYPGGVGYTNSKHVNYIVKKYFSKNLPDSALANFEELPFNERELS